MRKYIAVLFLVFALLLSTSTARAQSYSFNLSDFVVNVFWNEDGTISIDYVYTFKNDPGGHVIDYVDVAMPNNNFVESSIYADVSGKSINDISSSGYQGTGSGVAVGLGSYSIPAGQTGSVHVFIGKVSHVIYPDDKDQNYVSAVFAPAQFGSDVAHGSTHLSVTFYLPKGVKPEEPRWHNSPSGFPSQPETSLDNEGRVTYTWQSANANISQVYNFGASFPKQYVPDSAIVRPDPFAWVGTLFAWVGSSIACLIPAGCIGFFVLMIFWGAAGEKKRKLQYLPPKISIEGHGIKRGLTAVEAAILMEQPMDKIMTMILFSLVKKNAAQVATRDPLEIEAITPVPEGLQPYETEFLAAFLEKGPGRAKALQTMMVNAIKLLGEKMKGFSRRETVAYYKDIMQKAWAQVEAANTPEVKSQKYDENLEWTMLDGNYNERTRRVFTGGPVFIPMWWPRYDPVYRQTSASIPRPSTSQAPSGGGVSMPRLPGADFAASIVGGVQGFSQKVVGNIHDFTGKITNQTNPVPKPTTTSGGGGFRSGGGGGRSCACACACAGCACACAGGGR